MFYYYSIRNQIVAATQPDLPYQPYRWGEIAPYQPIFFLVDGDPVLGRCAFRVNHPGQLVCPDSLQVLDASRLPSFPLDDSLSAALAQGKLTAINRQRAGWEELLQRQVLLGKKRVHILALGDVGSTLLIGLKLLGQESISKLGIYDPSLPLAQRWELELGQVSLPWNYDAFPPVEIVSEENLFDCDILLFVASQGVPPVGAPVQDVRMAQLETNGALVRHYARMARKAKFSGLWCAVSDPVDPLAKMAYLESNRDDAGQWDGAGLLPEQVQGLGLGVMNARAAYFAKRDDRFASFLTQGRTFGPHGQGLVVANSIENYDEALSQELTQLTLQANLQVREIGFKPYVAPALSSGALTLLRLLRGEWHCGSVLLDGVYMGVKTRYTSAGLETELLPHIPDGVFARIEEAACTLGAISC